MSSIAGFFHPFYNYSKEKDACEQKLKHLSRILLHRGPSEQHFYYSTHACLNHNYLFSGQSTNPNDDFFYETLPATKKFKQSFYTIAYDGTIWNLPELAKDLQQENVLTQGLSEAELLICAYLQYGPSFVKKLNGGFSIVLLDERKNQLLLFRDPLGIKPLFYTFFDKTLIFASEPKGLLSFPNITPTLKLEGLEEIFSLGPARTPGSAVFDNMYELKAGHFLSYSEQHLFDERYFQFPTQPCHDSYEEALAHVKELVTDSVRTQMCGNAPLGAFLSGGLDSSVVSSICAKELSPMPLSTYSFDFQDSAKHFQANHFQPSLDAPYVQEMVDYLGTDHTSFECTSQTQFRYLSASVAAHDLPCMADVDASLLYFCHLASKHCNIVLTGECADELFCGYPWYHEENLYRSGTFPWAVDSSPRSLLLRDDFLKKLEIPVFLEASYKKAFLEFQPTSDADDDGVLHQKTYFLTLRWFMQTLLNRMDRAAAQTGLDARVPFADLRLANYLFTVPYAYKTKNGEVKHLLREAFSDLLPESVCRRKKSPYPKTYDPSYEALLAARLRTILSDSNSPLLEFVDRKKVLNFCQNPKDYGAPWYGQLMAGPQLMAYYIQIDEWLQKYQIKISL